MRIPRIYQNADLVRDASCLLTDGAAHHIANVLRMKPGQPLILFNGRGGYFDATIRHLEKRRVELVIGEHHAQECESPLNITLAQGISRGQRMDYTLQKAVELGVTKIVPLVCDHTNIKPDQAQQDKRLEHWRKIIISACEQCGRNRLPLLDPVAHFDDWVAEENPGLKIFLHPGASRTLTGLHGVDTGIVLLAGPEGGFSDVETGLAQKNGYQPVSLGPRILRTETTALAALTACQVLWGDLR